MPYEALLQSKPNISNIRILGSLVYRHIPTQKKSKLDIHSEKGILVGFESTNYLIYIPKRRTIISTRDIKIIEDSKYTESIDIEDEDYNYNNLPSYMNSEILTQEVNNKENDSISLGNLENPDENPENLEN
jgi:hypothetical protein